MLYVSGIYPLKQQRIKEHPARRRLKRNVAENHPAHYPDTHMRS